MRFDLPPTSTQIGLRSPAIAEAYDTAVKDRVITEEESHLILGAEVYHRRLRPGAVADLEKIATQAAGFFERRHQWLERDRFDQIVDFTLKVGGNGAGFLAEELAGTLASISDPVSLAHAARGLEKLRANDAFSAEGARVVGDAYYAVLQGMDAGSADWKGKRRFDHAIAVLLGAEAPRPGAPAPEQQIAHSLGTMTRVESLPHALRALEKVRANGVASKLIDDALYALLQKLDGPAALVDARKTFVDRLCALRAD